MFGSDNHTKLPDDGDVTNENAKADEDNATENYVNQDGATNGE